MMSRKMLAAIITVCSLAAIPNPIYAEEHEGKNQGIELSPGLLELLREENAKSPREYKLYPCHW